MLHICTSWTFVTPSMAPRASQTFSYEIEDGTLSNKTSIEVRMTPIEDRNTSTQNKRVSIGSMMDQFGLIQMNIPPMKTAIDCAKSPKT
mmetsp:Transcript_8187/g.10279  ORF Transcript_8187/g.10279 Transcript_8187/m.10279 type:complete len:89 (+) Transcript_8187:334-600(+)